MASGVSSGDGELGLCIQLTAEFECWQAKTTGEMIFLLECSGNEKNQVKMSFLLASEHEFTFIIPSGFPSCEGKVIIEAAPSLRQWSSHMHKLAHEEDISLTLLLDSAIELFTALSLHKCHRASETSGESEIEEDETDEPADTASLSSALFQMASLSDDDDDGAFTTEWELAVARKKKRWAQKELDVREAMKKSRLGPASMDLTFHASGQEKEQAKQIFTSSAASGILTNDLVAIMESQKNLGFIADPIEDNIYQWRVKLFNFLQESDIAVDLGEVDCKFGYDYIELQLDFAIDLYPFYPPLVKVIRPRLQGSMMQRVTNMEMLKLSYWNPAKSMKDVLTDIKSFLHQWARLEVNSERNDQKRFPLGSYVDIEHYLLHLALVSEVNPRANIRYHFDVAPAPNMAVHPATDQITGKSSKKRDEFWAPGVGYGHCNRPAEWDLNAYLAAQKEKDKQVEMVLHKILQELKKLYANHAPQLKPRLQQRTGGACSEVIPNEITGPASKQYKHEVISGMVRNSSEVNSLPWREEGHIEASEAESVDPVEDMYNILEGSALIPFIENYLRADSFLEICRHTTVYKVIVDVIKELALQPQLVPLLGQLSDQHTSVFQLLAALEEKASILLQHICKAGNGSIPKPPKRAGRENHRKGRDRGVGTSTGGHRDPPSPPEASSLCTAEEKLAREFQTLFRDITVAFKRLGIDPKGPSEDQPTPPSEVTMKETTDNKVAALEAQYKTVLSQLQFLSTDIEVEGTGCHHYANEFLKQTSSLPSQSQVFRIAQELTSLSTSLPLDQSSGIFLRTDDDKLILMKALITGPEGTPYAGGCFQFDIYFPPGYPKVPPMVNLQTTGGGSVRFNPNLYNCGKVCLSLLGTWEGQQGEQWNEVTSTVLQVLVSTQSLILVPEPYFNEPGYEQEIGTEAGRRHSADYNLDVQINTIKHAMIGQMQNPSHGFEDVICSHFYLKRERILKDVEGWMSQGKSSKLERAYQNLKQELYKLEAPPNIANLSQSSPTQLIDADTSSTA